MPHFPIFNTPKYVLSQSIKKRSSTNSAGRITKLVFVQKMVAYLDLINSRWVHTYMCTSLIKCDIGKGKN